MIMIIVNAVVMGLQTISKLREEKYATFMGILETTDAAFLIVFTIESVMQLIYHGYRLLQDGWLVFDATVVILSWAFPTMSVVRAFRIFRLLRLVKRVPSLNNLVGALLTVIPRMGAIALLLGLIFYIFAVLFTMLFKEVSRNGQLSEDYFGSFHLSLFTLFQMLTLEWSDVTRETMVIYSWSWAPILLYVFVSAFIFFNLVIAVICDAVAVNDDEEEEQQKAIKEADEEKTISLLKERVENLSARISEVVKSNHEMQHSLEVYARQLQKDRKRKIRVQRKSQS
eukprot:CAMPEP_0195540092 /NCGR_PEP_ID=MMETSP0794_2-20130614/50395_1 /TAXON_ID=515487 /ORGANISM="Stephanopyxis turris, Strain CCMP 815" /LENGTH=283 /DNA_ID=CAMNT_0040674155 /DNA_START=359 /DNA_END=1210 /DNA_ORIENTATION=+